MQEIQGCKGITFAVNLSAEELTSMVVTTIELIAKIVKEEREERRQEKAQETRTREAGRERRDQLTWEREEKAKARWGEIEMAEKEAEHELRLAKIKKEKREWEKEDWASPDLSS